jgi:hypothetical protein
LIAHFNAPVPSPIAFRKVFSTWFVEDFQAPDETHSMDEAMKPVLSDQHLGLKAFCDHNSVPQHFSHRHRIEKFSAKSARDPLVARAVRGTSVRSYLENRPEYLAQAQALLDEGLISPDSFDKFAICSEEFPWAGWHRVEYKISSCSKHAERFDGVVNQHLPVRVMLSSRWAVIREEMIR